MYRLNSIANILRSPLLLLRLRGRVVVMFNVGIGLRGDRTPAADSPCRLTAPVSLLYGPRSFGFDLSDPTRTGRGHELTDPTLAG